MKLDDLKEMQKLAKRAGGCDVHCAECPTGALKELMAENADDLIEAAFTVEALKHPQAYFSTLQKRLYAIREQRDELKKEFEDILAFGIRFDLTPTLTGPLTYNFVTEYLKRIDDAMRQKAQHTLDRAGLL